MKPIKKGDIGSTPNGVCPVTGLPILRKPEWTDVSFDTDYIVTFAILGDSILLVQASGYATLHGVEKAFRFLSMLENEDIGGGHPFVQIEDWADLQGASLKARKCYIDNAKKRERLLGLIFVGVSPMFELSIKLGKRLNIVNFETQIVNDYSDAVKLALEILSTAKMKEDKPIVASAEEDDVWSVAGLPTTSKPDWSIHLDGYSTRFEVIDGDILHGISTGFFEEEHIAPVLELQEKVVDSMGQPEGAQALRRSHREMVQNSSFPDIRLLRGKQVVACSD